jgi:hypothetical protein
VETADLGEYNYAIGRCGFADGRQGTFDQLYPTAHDKYGLAIRWVGRNITTSARGGLEAVTEVWFRTKFNAVLACRCA